MDEDKRIVIENLTTRYPGTEQPQLRQINAEVHAGQVVGIIGNSHSGKSTLCRVLAGVIPKMVSAEIEGTGTCLASECPTIGPFIMP